MRIRVALCVIGAGLVAAACGGAAAPVHKARTASPPKVASHSTTTASAPLPPRDANGYIEGPRTYMDDGIRVKLSSSQAANPVIESKGILTLGIVGKSEVSTPFTSSAEIASVDETQYTIRIGTRGFYLKTIPNGLISCNTQPVAAGSTWQAQACDTPDGVIDEIYDPPANVEAFSGYWDLISLYDTTVAALPGLFSSRSRSSPSRESTPPSVAAKLSPASVSAETGTDVPVVRCSTRYGVIPSPTQDALPSAAPTALLGAEAAGLEYYGNNQLFVLAPAGWVCSSTIGADGNPGMRITRGQETIDAGQTTGYMGSDEACAFFPGVKPDDPGLSCVQRPEGESVSTLSSVAVAFEDPPGVSGPISGGYNDNGSGGALPTNGILVYEPGAEGGNGFLYAETCVLPANEHATCTSVLNEALARAPF